MKKKEAENVPLKKLFGFIFTAVAAASGLASLERVSQLIRRGKFQKSFCQRLEREGEREVRAGAGLGGRLVSLETEIDVDVGEGDFVAAGFLNDSKNNQNNILFETCQIGPTSNPILSG